jgi:hypothetical protein
MAATTVPVSSGAIRCNPSRAKRKGEGIVLDDAFQ